MSIWDDPTMSMETDYVSFEVEGDSVKGVIKGIYAHTFTDGKVAPKLILDTDSGEKILTAGQFQLRQKLSDLRPEMGQTITVTFTGMNNLGGGKTMKLFDVVVEGASAPKAKTAAPNLTPEQVQAMELLKSSGLSA
jgi:hypothetical protein